MSSMVTLDTGYQPTTTSRVFVGNIEHPRPEWTDAQRIAWNAARTITLAHLELGEAHRAGVLPSYEPASRAYLAWIELEREIAPLFPSETSEARETREGGC